MHIAINAQLLSRADNYRGAGVSNYSYHLLQSLGELATTGKVNHRFTGFVNTPHLTIAGVELVYTSPQLVRPPLRIAWEQLALPQRAKQACAHLVHGLVNVLPLTTTLPGVVTVHDLSFLRLPERFPVLKRFYLTHLCRMSVARAVRVIAVSRQTAEDLQRFLGTPAEKIRVVYNGVASQFTPGEAHATAAFRQQHKLPSRFLLYLGTLEPRKNLELLVKAYARWQTEATPQDREVKLVLAGAKGWFYDEVFRLVTQLHLQDQVLFPGFIPPPALPDWYRAAEAFVYPSLFEGFGLPVAEAMACGVPVICSDTGSLCEIAGNCALTFPGDREEALVACLKQSARHPELRTELRQQGLQRVQRFSWQETAQATVAVYESILNNHYGNH